MNNFRIIALSGRDLVQDASPATLDRSHTCTPQIYRFDNINAAVYFATQCALSRNAWQQEIQIMDYNYIVPEEERDQITSFDQLKQEYPEILDGDIKVFCDCPSFIYGGFAYINTQLDTSLESEDRYPGIKNPGLEGTVCKHLLAILNRFFMQ